MSYESGTVVWVKLKTGRLWWAGEVTNDFPDTLLARNRTSPIAVVKFFSDENEFEIVKKVSDIVLYNCEKKAEFIRKGKLHLEKSQEDLHKFIDDCKIAESRTGGSEGIVETVEVAHSSIPKRPAYAELFKPKPPPTPQKSSYLGQIKLSFKKSGGGSPAKKPRQSVPTPQVVAGGKYNCDQCGFTSDRLSVLTFHRKSHSAGSVSVSLTPKKSKSPVKAQAVEKLSSPKKTVVIATKTSTIKASRKRKAPKEIASPIATDKQDILADWNDDNGDEDDEVRVPLDDDVEHKKPRTDKELAEAFETLLKKSKPTEAEGEESLPVLEPEPALESDDVDPHSDEKNESVQDTIEEVEETIESIEEELTRIGDVKVEPVKEAVKEVKDAESVKILDGKSYEIVESDEFEVKEVEEKDIHVEDKVVEDKVVEKESEDKVVEDKVVEVKVVEDKIVEDKLVEEKVVEDKVVEDKVVEDKVVEDKVVEDKVVEDKAVESKVVEEKVAEDKVVEEKEIDKEVQETGNKFEEKAIEDKVDEKKIELEQKLVEDKEIEEKVLEIESKEKIVIDNEVGEEPISETPESHISTPELNSTADLLPIIPQPLEVDRTVNQDEKEPVVPELETPKAVSVNPTAKVIGVSKVIPKPDSPPSVLIVDESKKPLTDEDFHSEVEAFLAATKPVEINHEKLFATRPDLQYTVTPIQLKKSPEPTSPLSLSPVGKGRGRPKKLTSTSPVSPIKTTPVSIMSTLTPLPTSTSDVHTIPFPVNFITTDVNTVSTMTHTVAVKSLPPIEGISTTGIESIVRGTGTLKITKPPQSFPMTQERIVVLPPDSSSSKSYPFPIPTQAVKVYSSQPSSSTGHVVVLPPANMPKKGRSKKQTITERMGIPKTIIQQPTFGQHVQLTSTGVKLVPAQTKVHSLPTMGLGPSTPVKSPTGMVRLTASAIQQQGLVRSSSTGPTILTKPIQQFKYHRPQTPLYVSSPSTAPSSHYEIVASAVGTTQEASEFICIPPSTQPPQQTFTLASSLPGTMQQPIGTTAQPKKRAAPRKNSNSTVGATVKTLELTKHKPTAAVKPTLSEEEKLNNMRIREAVLSGQKTEKIVAAENVVHLLPVENMDGTVTYMLVQMDELTGGFSIESSDGPLLQGEDPVYIDSPVAITPNKLLTALVQPPTPPRKVVNRKGQAIASTPATNTQHVMIPQQQQVQIVQKKQKTLGQQQPVPSQKQQTVSQQYQHLVQSQKQPQYHLVQSQKGVGIGQQQVFMSQAQPQFVLTQHQQQIAHAQQQQQLALVQQQQLVLNTQTQAIPQQQVIQVQVSSTPSIVPISHHVSQTQETLTQGIELGLESQRPSVVESEPTMPALIETKNRGIALNNDTSMPQVVQQEQMTEIVQQPVEHGQTQETGINQKVPIEVARPQEYVQNVQLMTAEDGSQYYTVMPEETLEGQQQTYIQFATTEGEGGQTIDFSQLGDQILILQEDGTLMDPRELGFDLQQLLMQQRQDPQEQLQAEEQIQHETENQHENP